MRIELKDVQKRLVDAQLARWSPVGGIIAPAVCVKSAGRGGYEVAVRARNKIVAQPAIDTLKKAFTGVSNVVIQTEPMKPLTH